MSDQLTLAEIRTAGYILQVAHSRERRQCHEVTRPINMGLYCRYLLALYVHC